MELARAAKKIGSSLEAHPVVEFDDGYFPDLLQNVDMAEVCITSGITVRESTSDGKPSGDGGREVDVENPYKKVIRWTGGSLAMRVDVQLAEGTKCARSWKILNTIGADPEYPDVSPRDAKALREWETMRKAAE
jgi:isoleucyl-tRNA synthetase